MECFVTSTCVHLKRAKLPDVSCGRPQHSIAARPAFRRRPRCGVVLATAEGPAPVRSPEVKRAIAQSEKGSFGQAASELRGNVPQASLDDKDARCGLARDLLDPLTLEKVRTGLSGGDSFDQGVASLYQEMSKSGVLAAFGQSRNVTLGLSAEEQLVSVERLVSLSGLPVEALSPRKSNLILWQLGGIALVSALMVAARSLGYQQVGGALVVGLGVLIAADQFILRGTMFENLYSIISPTFRDRVVHHEAAHFLVAYLHGLPISGYLLSGREALEADIPSFGQGGTIFLFPELAKELQEGLLRAKTINTWATVLMAGIAGEAISYGRADGGASDERTLIGLLAQLGWSPSLMKSQARFGVLQAILTLKSHPEAYKALVEKMRERASLGECIATIERLVGPAAVQQPQLEAVRTKSEESMETVAERHQMSEVELTKREEQVLAELAKIKEKLQELEGRH